MPVKYIDVQPISELFAPAVRAYGDIAIVGKGPFGAPAADPQAFTSPGAAAQALQDAGGTTLTVDAAKDASKVTVKGSVSAPISVRIDTGAASEVRKVTRVDPTPAPEGGTAPGTFDLALDTPLERAHVSNTAVAQAGDSDLLRAIRTAFRQSPPPVKVWGVLVDQDDPQWDTALTKVDALNVQIVLLANTPLKAGNTTALDKLANHVSADLGDGKERIGVAMLDKGPQSAATLNTLIVPPVKHERMVLIAHTSDDDVAAATAGVIAGYQPHISLLLKPINIAMTRLFTDTEIEDFDGHQVNWVTSPALLPGQSLYLGEGYTADSSHGKKYVDVVRALDDINFRIKAALIEAIGTVRISRVGLRSVVTIVQSVLFPLVSQEVIEDFSVVIPLLALLDKDQPDEAEQAVISKARSNREVDMTVQVTYAGAIHRLKISLVLKG
ncbi:hypothetical protein ACFVHB_28605 [Kitasatospora sp. NPDC127111]|uniref:hypothetical protein n=1 Tax=Kitasatospora sp. NPDC127111 TaxID=3345363 RepID=UPI0036406E11